MLAENLISCISNAKSNIDDRAEGRRLVSPTFWLVKQLQSGGSGQSHCLTLRETMKPNFLPYENTGQLVRNVVVETGLPGTRMTGSLPLSQL